MDNNITPQDNLPVTSNPAGSTNQSHRGRSKLSKYFGNQRIQLLLVVALVAVVGTWLLSKSFADQVTVASFQAETMKASRNAKVVQDASASGGSMVRFTDTGSSISKSITLPSDVSSMTMVARADSCQTNGWPQVKATIDGKVVLPKVNVANANWTSYSATNNISAGSHTIKLSYPSTTTNCLATLYVDVISFYGSSTPTSPAPSVTLTANPTSVSSGTSSVLTWSTVNATTCTASGGWSGTQSTSGSYTTPALTANTTYTLSCTGTGGVAQASATVNVTTTTTPPPTTGTMWKPTADRPLAFHWVLGDTLNVTDPIQMGLRDFNGNTLPEPDVYDIDGDYNTAATVSYLHSKGKKVICYIDAGVYETYRADAYKFQALSPQIWGNADQGWAGSYWLDIRRVDELAPIMQARMQMCKDKGFDAIEPDEITNWSNNPGFPITYQDQIVYNRAVASWAHNLGLSIGLKGDLEQAHDLVGNYDWTLNEECYQYSECTTINNSGGPGADGKDYPGLQLFAQANKAVWVAEYKNYTASAWTSICTDSQKNHFNTTLFKLGLPNNGGRKPCPTTSATTW